MDELIDEIEQMIESLKSRIDRNKRVHEFSYMDDTSHYYRLMFMCCSLERWESVLKMIVRYRNNRCTPIEKKSDKFTKIIEVQVKGTPGFVTKQTINSMIDYMKQLEWKVDSLNGIWKDNIT